MQLLGSIAAVALASATLCGTAHAQGSAPYDPSGWRPATEYEKKVAEAENDGVVEAVIVSKGGAPATVVAGSNRASSRSVRPG